jgi:hypothetical protein
MLEPHMHHLPYLDIALGVSPKSWAMTLTPTLVALVPIWIYSGTDRGFSQKNLSLMLPFYEVSSIPHPPVLCHCLIFYFLSCSFPIPLLLPKPILPLLSSLPCFPSFLLNSLWHSSYLPGSSVFLVYHSEEAPSIMENELILLIKCSESTKKGRWGMAGVNSRDWWSMCCQKIK